MTKSENLEEKLMDCLRLLERKRATTLGAIAYLRHLLKTAEDERFKKASRRLLREWQSDVRICDIATVALREILERVQGGAPEPVECVKLPENLQQIKDYAKKTKS